jgi:hypothetical protein
VQLRQHFDPPGSQAAPAAQPESPAAASTAAPLPSAELNQLLSLLEQGDSSAIDYWQDHLATFRTGLPAELLEQINRAITGFDLEAAAKVLAAFHR